MEAGGARFPDRARTAFANTLACEGSRAAGPVSTGESPDSELMAQALRGVPVTPPAMHPTHAGKTGTAELTRRVVCTPKASLG